MRNHDMARIFSVGLLTFLIFSVLLFGVRKILEIPLWNFIGNRSYWYGQLQVQAPFLETGLDPEVKIAGHASISAYISDRNSLGMSFALSNNLAESLTQQHDHTLLEKTPTGTKIIDGQEKKYKKMIGRIWFDAGQGLFVFKKFPEKSDQTNKEAQPEQAKPVNIYFGPNGAGEKPSSTLGRFHDPISAALMAREGIIVYERSQPYFYRIEVLEQKVTKGPKLPDKTAYLQLSCLQKAPGIISLDWNPPYKVQENSAEQTDAHRKRVTGLVPIEMAIPWQNWYADDFIPVLNEEGIIERLDADTLEITGSLGHLVTRGFNQLTQMIKPRDVLAYDVKFVVARGEYQGLAVACLDRNMQKAAIASFDNQGAKLQDNDSKNKIRNSQLVNYTTMDIANTLKQYPMDSLYKVTKFLVEALNPLALNMISCYTAGKFEAISSRQALFFLSDTYTAQTVLRDDNELTAGLQLIGLSLPVFLYSLVLAWRVSKNARQVGLSRNMQTFWIIMVIFFGIPAYITYRLTRPEMVLVSCRNCGQMRRPDLELCHQCKSPWLVPELVPPTWRVREG